MTNSGFIDLTKINLYATPDDFDRFSNSKPARTLFTKAEQEGYLTDITVSAILTKTAMTEEELTVRVSIQICQADKGIMKPEGFGTRCIAKYLGHTLFLSVALSFTERYLHISKQRLVNIISPLDDLFKKEKIDR